MTAIGVFGTQSGFVIAADGRMRLDDATRATAGPSLLSMESDETQKIFPIEGTDRALAFTMTGNIASDDLQFRMWEKARQITSGFAQKQFRDGRKYVNALSFLLNNEINTAKQAGIINFDRLKEREHGNGWSIAKLFVAGYFNHMPWIIITEFYHANERKSEYDINVFWLNLPLLIGPQSIQESMYNHQFLPVDNSAFAQYIRSLPPDPTLEEARELVTGYVEACCTPLARSMDPVCERIGGHIHVAQITPIGGFEWIISPKSHLGSGIP